MQTLDLIKIEIHRKVSLTFALIVVLVFSFGCSKTSGNSNFPRSEPAMKEIVYRGGIVVFSIPSSWKEEYEPNGGATYQEGPNTGTLRLSVLTFSAEDDPKKMVDISEEAKRSAGKFSGESFDLKNGNTMARYDKDSTENGSPIRTRFWQVYNRVGSTHLRIAVFSYSQYAAMYSEDATKQELEMLEREIRKARFAETLGITQ